MSTIKSSNEHLTINADGSSKDIKFQANGVEKASISSAGAFTSTTIDATKLTGNLPAISGAALTGVGVAGITSSADATAMTIDSNEHVGIGITPKIISGGSKYLTVGTQTAGQAGFLELVGNRTANAGQDLAIMKFVNNTTEIAEIGAYDNGSTNGGVLKFKTSSGGTSATSMTIDSSGQVTMPLQPAFMWKGVATNFTPDTSATLFVFDSEVFDIGNNAVNNRFTAPVAGVYHFDVLLQHAGPGANTETRYMQMGFRKNGSNLDEHSSLQAMEAVADGWGSGNSYHPQQISTNIQLSANDYVDITVSRSSSSDWNGTFNSDRTRWSGYLIG
jgi:hypothetical protein